MATFNLGSGTDLNNLDDISKVKSYLFQLTEQLRYMFNNLDPQDNYSEQARLTLVTDGERQATIEASLNGILLNYVSKEGIVSAINLSDELIQIEASKIKLEGVVTVNGNFKVGLDGSIEANNGKFKGDIEASNITGSVIRGSHLYGTFIGDTSESFYVVEDADHEDVAIGLGDGFDIRNRVLRTTSMGSWYNAASDDDSKGAIDGYSGTAGFSMLYVRGVSRDIASEISALWDAIDSIDDGGDDNPTQGGQNVGEGGDGGDPGDDGSDPVGGSELNPEP